MDNKLYNDFKLFARDNKVSSSLLDDYTSKTTKNIRNGYIEPSILEERQLNVTQIGIFSRLLMDRILFMGTDIDDTVSNIVVSQLLFLDSVDKTGISMYINSGGGSVYSGFAIYDVMQQVDSEVSTVCVGCAASMASILLSGGEKGKRLATPHSRIMIHQPLGGIQGQASDIEITAKEILKVKNELYETLSLHTGKSIEEITKDADRDFWMTANEAVEYGIIDEVINKKHLRNDTF